MLTIKCAGCKQKLFKYRKVGSGSVLRCHKERIQRHYSYRVLAGRLVCGGCGQVIGQDKGTSFGMDRKAFTATGTTETKKT
jgi:hypothetical protein